MSVPVTFIEILEQFVTWTREEVTDINVSDVCKSVIRPTLRNSNSLTELSLLFPLDLSTQAQSPAPTDHRRTKTTRVLISVT
jgi:hypothetical protein